MPTVVIQYWEESERGWGVRPDGFSLHRSMDDWYAFVKEYNAKLPKDHVPDEYTRVSGVPQPVDLPVTVTKKIKGNGTWFTGNLSTLVKGKL